jgi:hypothetical protein
MGRGRPKGTATKVCLIKDKSIFPYEIHRDNANYCFILYNKDKETNVSYHTTLSHALKRTIQRVRKDNKSTSSLYNLVEQFKQIKQLEKEHKDLIKS